MRDPYELLGVPRHATAEEIKSAFRKKAALHHPDRNPGDPDAHQRFKEVNAAYQLLSDPKKRAAFDRFGGVAFGDRGAGPFGGVKVDFADLNLDGLFGDLLGALGIKVGDKGNIQRELTLTFEEAVEGCTKKFTYPRSQTCDTCGGSGAASGAKVRTCTECKGRGKVRAQQTILPFAFERPCTQCNGTGRRPEVACSSCNGAGVAMKDRTIDVEIPPGADSGSTRTIERAGHYVRSDRPAGDLELTLRVAPHELFRRSGDNLVCKMPISFATAALGGDIPIPTLHGKGRLRIPPGTQSGTVLRVKGKGVPRRGLTIRGDLLVEVAVEVPTQLNDHQRKLVEELGEALGEHVQPQQATFMERLKSLFG